MAWQLPEGVRSSKVETDEAVVHYLESGQEGMPVWVLFHPMPLSSYMWRHVMAKLGENFHVYAPDLVGLGYSQAKSSKGFGLVDQIEVMRACLANVLPQGKLSLFGHGWGALIVHGLVSSLQDRVSEVGFYEAYLHPILNVSDMGLPIMELHSQMNHHPLGNPDGDFILDEFLPLIEEGRVSAEVSRVFKEPFSHESSRVILRRFLLELLDVGPNSVVNQVIEGARGVYDNPAVKKRLLYSMPGLLNSVLRLDDFRNQYPGTKIYDVGEGFFMAPEFSPEQFALAIKAS